MEKYLYDCERCEERFELEQPVDEYQFRVHKSCPNHELVLVSEDESKEEMPNIMIEMDYLGEDINSFISTGVVIARLEYKHKHICLETNGEEGDMYLEVVVYDLNDRGDYVESSFSDPIYEMPDTVDEVEALFEDWLEVVELPENFTGGMEVVNEEGYRYWSYENGQPIKPLSPAFKERKDFIAWMEKHYA